MHGIRITYQGAATFNDPLFLGNYAMTTSTTEAGSSNSSSSNLKLPGLSGIPGATGATETIYRKGVYALVLRQR
jgi:hypothetical protein